MRVLVCGGRDFGNLPEFGHGRVMYGCSVDKKHPDYPQRLAELEFVKKTLSELFDDKTNEYCMPPPDLVLIHGGARGADRAADEWAVVSWVVVEEYKADWKNDGRAAGPIRNQRMLDLGKPDLVIAFPGGRGTADMVKRARKAGVEVMEIRYLPKP